MMPRQMMGDEDGSTNYPGPITDDGEEVDLNNLAHIIASEMLQKHMATQQQVQLESHPNETMLNASANLHNINGGGNFGAPIATGSEMPHRYFQQVASES